MRDGRCDGISYQWRLIPYSSSPRRAPLHRFLQRLLLQYMQSLAGYSRLVRRTLIVVALLLLRRLPLFLFFPLLRILLFLAGRLWLCLCPRVSTLSLSVFSFSIDSSSLRKQVQVSWRCFVIDEFVRSNLIFWKRPSAFRFVAQKYFCSHSALSIWSLTSSGFLPGYLAGYSRWKRRSKLPFRVNHWLVTAIA